MHLSAAAHAAGPAGLPFPSSPFRWAKPVLAGPKKAEAPRPLPPADVETAEQLYAKLEYDDANKVAERVIAKRGLTHEQLVRAYRILAVTHAVLDHDDAAREAFIALLTYDAEYAADPNLGPKVSAPFFEARGFWRAQAVKPGLEVTAALRAQDTGTLRVTTRDPTHIVRRVLVGFRWDLKGDFVVSSVAVGEGMALEIVEPPTGRTRLEYYVQAFDDHDDVVLELGTPALPRSALTDLVAVSKARARTEERASSSVLSSALFWTVTGIVVAGAATAGGYLLLRPKNMAAPTSATLTPTLQCGSGAKCN